MNLKLKIFFLYIIFFGLLGLSKNVLAVEYYVSPSSVSTNWSAAQNIASPCTPQTAMANAMAGDTVYFRGGTYELGPSTFDGQSDPGYHSTLEPANSGTVQNPIIFKAYPDEVPILNGHVAVKVMGVADAGTDNNHLVDNDVDFVALGIANWDIFRTTNKDGGAAVESVAQHEVIFQGSSHNSNVNLSAGDTYEIGQDNVSPIGVYRKEYVIIDGFKVQADNGTNSARIIITNHSLDFNASGLTVRNCEIDGGSRKIVHGDNREGIRVERTVGAHVYNTKVYNFNQMVNGHNTSAFKTYDNDNLIFENNEAYNSTVGMYIKRRTSGAIIRNNYIHDNYQGIITTSYISAEYSSERNISIYNNLIVYSENRSLDDSVQETSDSDNMRVYNNTIYTGNQESATIVLGPGTKYFYNNIVVGQPTDYDTGHLKFYSNNPASGGVAVRIMECDHNLFDPTVSSQGLSIRTVKYDGSNVRVTRNFDSVGSWQFSGELDGGANPGTGSLLANPQFINSSGSMSEIEDFVLSINSPGKESGRSGADMGVNVSLVGIQNLGFDTIPPSAPSNLNVL